MGISHILTSRPGKMCFKPGAGNTKFLTFIKFVSAQCAEENLLLSVVLQTISEPLINDMVTNLQHHIHKLRSHKMLRYATIVGT